MSGTTDNGSFDPADPGERLSAYLDGDLTDAARAELEADLARDPELRSELDGMRSAVTLLRRVGPARAPRDFHARVLAAAEAEAPARTSDWWAWLRRPFGLPIEALALAGAAAAVLWFAIPPQLATEVIPEAGNGRLPDLGSLSRKADPAAQEQHLDPKADANELQQQWRAPTPSPLLGPAQSEGTSYGNTAAVDNTANPVESGLALENTGSAPPPAAGTADAVAIADQTLAGPAFAVASGDPEILAEIASVASRFRAVPLDAAGARVPVETLARGDERDLWLDIPQERLGEFESALRASGVQLTVDRPADLLPAGTVRVRVSVAVTATAPPGKLRAKDFEVAEPAAPAEQK